MRRVFMFGVACAAMAFIVMAFAQSLALPIQNVLSGLAMGAALGLIRTHSPLARISAFLVGLVVGIVFFLLRAALLPGTWLGNAIAVVVVILVMTLISGLTSDRLPLWAMFMAAALFAASYGVNFEATEWLILQQLPATAAGLLFSVAAGFVVALLAEWRVERGGVSSIDPMEPTLEGVDPNTAVPAAAGISVMDKTDRVGM